VSGFPITGITAESIPFGKLFISGIGGYGHSNF